jgi:hypothetical protein
MPILVTGATGLVGRALAVALEARGDDVVKLSRSASPGHVAADPTRPGDWLSSVDAADAVVHLAGENIFAKRWTADFKAKIRSSRVDSTRIIAERMATKPLRPDGTPKTLIVASAVGYYGPRGDDLLTEDSPPGDDFMAEVCRGWEAAADPARQAGVRVCHPRLGIVLEANGGALPQLLRPFRFFVGGRVGSGRQWVSWIHIDDLTNLLLHMLEAPDLRGPVNAVAPNPVRNAELSAAVAKAIGRPNWLSAPAFGVRMALGEVADVVTTGQRVVPAVMQTRDFAFQFPTIEGALVDLLR